MEYKLVIEPIINVKNINSNLHIELAPFTSLGDLVYVNMDWWKSLSIKQRSDIIRNFGYEYGFCIRSSFIRNKDDINNKAFWKFHTAYINSHKCQYWCDYMNKIYCICSLDKNIVEKIIFLSRENREKQIVKIDVNSLNFKPLIKLGIESFIQKHQDIGIFYKLGSKQTKCNGEIPSFSLEGLLKDMINNQNIIDYLSNNPDNDKCIILEPWNYEIETINEYRVIIHDHKIKGISQQQCYKFIGLDESKVRSAALSIIKLWETLKLKIHYRYCVLDVWVDTEAHLMNIDPGEGWSNSGCGLFHWIDDKDKIGSLNVNLSLNLGTTSSSGSSPSRSDASDELFYSVCNQVDTVYVKYIDSKSPLLKSLSKSNSSIDSLKLEN